MDRVVLRQLSVWMGFVGIMTIISGVFSVISGLFTFIIGAVPGIIAIILGVKLRNAKHYVDAMQTMPSNADFTTHFNMLAVNLNSYFKIQGILIIIVLVILLFVFILGALVGIAFFSRWM